MRRSSYLARESRDTIAPQLREASGEGNLNEVRRLLVEGGAASVINDADDNGLTALHKAASSGHAEVVFILLAARADVNARTNSGNTALIRAAAYGHAEVASLLLDAGADVNAKNSNGLTALILASSNRHAEEVVAVLLAAGADVEARNNDGRTALMDAVSNGRDKVVSLLLAAGADMEARSNDGWTSLIRAAAYGCAKVVSLLLAAGAGVEARTNFGNTALIRAAAYGHAEVVSLLLDAGADVEAREDTYRGTALINAAMNGHPEVVSLLLVAGADMEARNNSGTTAFLIAAIKGRAGVVSVLLDAGADMEVRNNRGNTALIHAAGTGHAEVVSLLLDAGANVNAKNKQGETALVLAILFGYPHIADDILTCGGNVDVSAPISNGATARSLAKAKDYTGLLQKIEAAARAFVPGPSPFAQRQSNAATETQLPSPIASLDLPMSRMPSAPKRESPPISHPRAVTPATPPPLAFTAVTKQAVGAALHSTCLIPYSDLQLGAELGRGSFAKVYNASWQETDVAVKVFDLPGGAEEEEFSASLLSKISAEADLLASIRHPNVVAFLGMCQEPPCVVTENCSRGSLFGVLRHAKIDAASAAQLTWARRLSMAVDAATGMLHLHQRSPPVMHRDLKSPNLLVNSDWKVKVSDLGLSRLVDEVNATATAGSTAGQLNPRWMAPEVVEEGRTTPSSDVFAFGVVLWELLTWELPWSHVPNPVVIIAWIMRGDLLPIPGDGASPGPRPVHSSTYREYITLFKQCTARVPAERPQFAAIVQKLKALVEREGGAPVLEVRQGSSDGGSATASAVCVVCMEQPSTAGLVHRSAEMVHRCCCETCAKLLRSRGDACPMCRRPIDEVLLHFH